MYDKDWEVHLALNDPLDPIHEHIESGLMPPLNVVTRLEALSRSPEQDLAVRRLIANGVEMTALDAAMPREVLIFRDRTENKRWAIERDGRVVTADETDWTITS